MAWEQWSLMAIFQDLGGSITGSCKLSKMGFSTSSRRAPCVFSAARQSSGLVSGSHLAHRRREQAGWLLRWWRERRGLLGLSQLAAPDLSGQRTQECFLGSSAARNTQKSWHRVILDSTPWSRVSGEVNSFHYREAGGGGCFFCPKWGLISNFQNTVYSFRSEEVSSDG